MVEILLKERSLWNICYAPVSLATIRWQSSAVPHDDTKRRVKITLEISMLFVYVCVLERLPLIGGSLWRCPINRKEIWNHQFVPFGCDICCAFGHLCTELISHESPFYFWSPPYCFVGKWVPKIQVSNSTLIVMRGQKRFSRSVAVRATVTDRLEWSFCQSSFQVHLQVNPLNIAIGGYGNL